MRYCFGRTVHETDTMSVALAELELGTSFAEQAIAYNWRNDGNVLPEREVALRRVLDPLKPNPESLRSRYKEYRITRIQQASEPDYADSILNKGNFLTALAPNQSLVRILWLGSGHMYRAASRFIPEVQALKTQEWNEWLVHGPPPDLDNRLMIL